MASILFVIPALAVLAPLIARGLSRWVRIPIVVFELLLGIVVGPSLLGWAEPSEFTSTLADLGLAMLFFLAGNEIQVQALRGRGGRRAASGWLISLLVGFGIGWIVAPGETAVIIAIALSSTALGTIMPILRDAGEMHTPFGASISAIGAIGEFGPLLAISIFLGTRDLGLATAVVALFIVIAAIAIWLSIRLPPGGDA